MNTAADRKLDIDRGTDRNFGMNMSSYIYIQTPTHTSIEKGV